MIIDIDQIVFVQINEARNKYNIFFKSGHCTEISLEEYNNLVQTINKLEDVGCSLLCI